MKSKLKLLLLTAFAVFGLSASPVRAEANYHANGGAVTTTPNTSPASRQYQRRVGRYRNSRITPQEARRLQRERARLVQQRNRAYRDGYITPQERRRLAKKAQKYQRNVRRDRRDW